MFLNNTKTYPPVNGEKNYKIQKGSSLVIAIFIIIVMSLVASTLVSMLTTSQHDVAIEVLGTRAYSAAQSGVQWKLGQLFPIGTSTTALTCAAVQAIPVPVLNNIQGFEGCVIAAVVCTDFINQDINGNNVRYYNIQSTGQCNIDGEVTSRTIEVQAHSVL